MMFDRLWDESPKVQEMKRQSEVRGEARGVVQGEVQGMKRLFLQYVQMRFPALTELTQAKIKLVNEPDALYALHQQVLNATDTQAVQQLLIDISEEQS